MTDFGYSTIGAATDNPSVNYIWLKATSTPASNGTLTLIQAHCQQRGTQGAGSQGSGTKICYALYTDSAGAPSSLVVANETGVAVAAGFAWVSQSFSQAITSGTQYWFAIRLPNASGTNNDANVHEDTNGSLTEGYFKAFGLNSDPFPATVTGATSFANERWSIYGTYTPDVTGMPDGSRHMQPMQQFLLGW